MLLLLYGTFLQHFAGHKNGLLLILPDSLKDTQSHEINMPEWDAFCMAYLSWIQTVGLQKVFADLPFLAIALITVCLASVGVLVP